MTPFDWWSVALMTLSLMAGIGLKAIIEHFWPRQVCKLEQPPPGRPRSRPQLLEEDVSWGKPAPAPRSPRHVRPKLEPPAPGDYDLPPAPGARAQLSAGGGV